MPSNPIITSVAGRKLKLTNPQKLIYPELGVFKAEVIKYFLDISEYLLPQIKNRPLTLIRYPDGVEGKRFYSKNKPVWTPDWITSTLFPDDNENHYIQANEVATLGWIGNLAGLEIHPMNVRSPNLNFPDQFIFDLDPSTEVDFPALKELANNLKIFLEKYGYTPFIKTSGGKGLHIYVPIIPINTIDEVYKTAKDLAREYVKNHDKSTTLKISKTKRKGKILLDIYRNSKAQSCVAPFSPRGKIRAPVSTPFSWDFLEKLPNSQHWTLKTILPYLKKEGNHWKNFHQFAIPLHVNKQPVKGKLANYQNTSKATKSKDPKEKPWIIQEKETQKINIHGLKNPMLATVGKTIPGAKTHFYEIKWDGIRAVFVIANDCLTIYSRNGNDITDQFPQLQILKDQIEAETAVLDGEIVFLDEAGKPLFHKIVGRIHVKGNKAIEHAAKSTPAVVYLFDLLYLDGKDCREETNTTRRIWLRTILTNHPKVRYSETFADGNALLEGIKAQGMEGMICKRKNGKYHSGKRSNNWKKIKIKSEDTAWIIGYTSGEGDRVGSIGALHLAKKDKANQWKYMGKVGTGFDDPTLKIINERITALPPVKKPISDPIKGEKLSTWVQPIYQCEINYASFSSNGTYREPVFQRII